MAATIAAFRKHCLSLPGTTYDVKWGNDHCYSIGKKMYAVFGPKNFSFKVDDNRFLELTDMKGIIPAPYMAKHKWVLIEDLKVLPEKDVRALLTRSHELILSKLPKKFRDSLA